MATGDWTVLEQKLATGRSEHAVVAFFDAADNSASALSVTMLTGLILGFASTVLPKIVF
jgi:hypothetical protein